MNAFLSSQTNTTIVRRRRGPGSRGARGNWVEGPATETVFRAVVQPIRVEDRDTEGGVQVRQRLRIYIADPDALRAAFDDAEADQVDVDDGNAFVVERSESWPGFARAKRSYFERPKPVRWPWSKSAKPERRSAGGGYSDAIVRAIEAQASSTVADAGSTAAIEAAAGALSRALMAVEVEGPGWVKDAITPVWLSQVGRSLVREGSSLSVVGMRHDRLTLAPAASWNFEGGTDDEESWMCRATVYGPSTSNTRLLTRDRIVCVRWGTSPGTRYRGQGPTSFAAHDCTASR